jgi:AcrR family transcriptional regulator
MPGPKAPPATRRQQILDAAYDLALDEGIAGLTLRAVAARAGLSHGLVIFHFKQKDQLVTALLDRLLLEIAEPQDAPATDMAATAGARWSAVVRREMLGLARDPRRVQLLLEYWALGVRDRSVRRRIAAALARYRSRLRPTTEPHANALAGIDGAALADAIASVAVSLVSGFAMQATIAHAQVDAEVYGYIIDRLVASVLNPPPQRRSRVRHRDPAQRPRRR